MFIRVIFCWKLLLKVTKGNFGILFLLGFSEEFVSYKQSFLNCQELAFFRDSIESIINAIYAENKESGRNRNYKEIERK